MRQSSGTVRRARPLLGTLVEIRVDSARPAALQAVERAFAAVERVHRAMSVQESSSDIARLRSGDWCALDPWTRRVLERAEEIRLATDGLFDCAACGYALDGIAKGFAVDQAVECLQGAGIAAGVVNAGGDLRVFGDESEEIYLRLPQRPAQLVRLGRLRNAAIATSARAGLVDPLSAPGRSPAVGATVIADDCMTADALTKPCLLEPGRAAELAARFGARAIIL
jgi:thiamine biosynthesis lipoprotein